MIPSIDKVGLINQIVHPIDQIKVSTAHNTNKKKKQVPTWTDKMKIISFSMPEANQSQTIVRKYKIRLVYEDEKGNRQPKTIFFGDDSDFVFNKDNNKRTRRLLSMKYLDNPLHPNYWKALLLNKYSTMG